MAADFFQKLGAIFNDAALTHPETAGLVLRVVVDHMATATDHTPDDLARIEALMLAALRHAPALSVALIAERFARHPQAPAAVLEALVESGGTAAGMALAFGRGVPRYILVREAEFGTANRAAAIAMRADLDFALSTLLLRRPESEILVALAANPSARLDRASLSWLVQRGRRDGVLARSLLSRGLLPHDATPLFMAASAEQRAAMIVEARRRDLGRPPGLAPILEPAAQHAIDAALRARDEAAVIEWLAFALTLARAEVLALAHDPGGEPLAVMLGAAALGAHHVRAAMDLLRPAEREPSRIDILTDLFATLPAETCRRLLGAIVGRPAGPAQVRVRHDREIRARSVSQTRASRKGDERMGQSPRVSGRP